MRLSGRLRPVDDHGGHQFNRWSRRGFWFKRLDTLVGGCAVVRNTAIGRPYALTPGKVGDMTMAPFAIVTPNPFPSFQDGKTVRAHPLRQAHRQNVLSGIAITTASAVWLLFEART